MTIKDNLEIFCNKIAISYYKFLKNYYAKRSKSVAEKGTRIQRIQRFLAKVDKFIEEGAKDLWRK